MATLPSPLFLRDPRKIGDNAPCTSSGNIQGRSIVAFVNAESTAALRYPGVRPKHTPDCTIAATLLAT